jgi:putative Holliday junction resolvase
MIYLAVDFGNTRIGLAKSDSNGIIAYPMKTVYSKKNIIDDANLIINIAKEINSRNIVIGLPINMNGSPSKMSIYIKKITKIMKKIYDCEVKFLDERLTTVQANRIIQDNKRNFKDNKNSIDAVSAAVILESFLLQNEGNKN